MILNIDNEFDNEFNLFNLYQEKKWYQEKCLLNYFIFHFYIYQNLHNNIVITIENILLVIY